VVLAESNGGLGSAAIETSARRHIWLCADDYGISPSVNTAIRDLIVRGRLNATSVMVVAGASHRSEAIALNVLNSDQREKLGTILAEHAGRWEARKR